MKAVRIHRFGPPEVVVVEEIPKATPGNGEVLVRVSAAVARAADRELLRRFGVETIVNSSTAGFESSLPQVDAVLDTVGGSTVERCVNAVKPGGRLVSVVAQHPPQKAGMEAVFFYAEVSSDRLHAIRELFERRKIVPRVGSVMPLNDARRAHEMLAGAPHKSGKIVLDVIG